MFDVERFTDDCIRANAEVDAPKAVLELVERTCSDPAAVLVGLGEPTEAGVTKLYRSDELTILNLVWGPQMTLLPHNHQMWAVIGIYTGREDNIFWRRQPGRDDGFLKAQGARSLGSRDTVPLGKDVIHSVTNPLGRLTGAIHVYGGDFFGVERSEWDPETLTEGRYDVEKNMRLIAESNARLAAA